MKTTIPNTLTETLSHWGEIVMYEDSWGREYLRCHPDHPGAEIQYPGSCRPWTSEDDEDFEKLLDEGLEIQYQDDNITVLSF